MMHEGYSETTLGLCVVNTAKYPKVYKKSILC